MINVLTEYKRTVTDDRNGNQLFPMRREGREQLLPSATILRVKLKVCEPFCHRGASDVTICSAASHILDTDSSGSQEYVVSLSFCAVNPLSAVIN